MKTMSAKFGFHFLALTPLLMIFPLSACNGGSAQDASAAVSPVEPLPLVDAPLPGYRKDLLALAFDTATSIPLEPHIKDRSRAQEKVVAACLKLDQPASALGYMERIDDWRRGSCYADLAFHNAGHGRPDQARRWIDRAAEVAASTEDWRRDAIRVRIAQTHALLGHDEKADRLSDGVVDSEKGKLAAARAMVIDEEAFDEQLASIDALVAAGNFDVLKNALESATVLFDRFHDDAGRRTRVEEKIRASWEQLPIFIRIELLMTLADSALEHDDRPKALELTNDARAFLDGYDWPAQYRVPLAAKIAKARFRAGDVEKARSDADAVLALFKEQRETIVNIDRAETLQPLAETYHAMGDTAKALSVYRMALDEGVVNPNSRPRAEDLSATCVSMALCAVEPDPELWQRIREIREGLGKPW
jgi:hypothetical protein